MSPLPTDINVAQAADRLGVKASRVRQLILAGRLPAVKVGRDWIIDERDLVAVADRRPGKPPRKRDQQGIN